MYESNVRARVTKYNFFQIGTFLIPALSIPLLLFAGFFVKLGEMSVYLQPLGNVSFFRYIKIFIHVSLSQNKISFNIY